MITLLLIGIVAFILLALMVGLTGESHWQCAVSLIPLVGAIVCMALFAKVANDETNDHRNKAKADADACVRQGGTPVPQGAAGFDIMCVLP